MNILEKINKDAFDTSKKFKKGQKVTFGGDEYIVVVPDAKANLVGIVPIDKENDINSVDLVPAHELNRKTEKKKNKVDQKPFETGDDFKKGETVIYNNKEYKVIISDARGPLVGIIPVDKENDIDYLKLVRAFDLTPKKQLEESNPYSLLSELSKKS